MYNLGRKYTDLWYCVDHRSSSSNNGKNMRMSGMNDWIKQEILFESSKKYFFESSKKYSFISNWSHLSLIFSPVHDPKAKLEKSISPANKTSKGYPQQLKAVTVQYEKYILNDPISPLSHKFHFHFQQLQFRFSHVSPVFNFERQFSPVSAQFHIQFLPVSLQFQFHSFHLFLLSSSFYLFLLSLLARFGSRLPTTVCWCDQPLAVTTLKQI